MDIYNITTSFDQEQQSRREEAANSYNNVLKEHLFDKVLTPSDVGKLNRLVIHKHHAEKYFPILSDYHNTNELQNGTMLKFQDKNDKIWMFRYSYWHSSQSYVMTKGWNRFVNDKNLNAGDTVSFLRETAVKSENSPKMFIDWKYKSNLDLLDNINHHKLSDFTINYPKSRSMFLKAGDHFPVMDNYMPVPYRRLNQRLRFYEELSYLEDKWTDPVGILLTPCNNKEIPVTISCPLKPPVKKIRLFGVNIEVETRGEIGASSSSSSSLALLNREYKRKGKGKSFEI